MKLINSKQRPPNKDGDLLSLVTDADNEIKAKSSDADMAVGAMAQVYLCPEAIGLTHNDHQGFEGNVNSGFVETVLFNGANRVVAIGDNANNLLNVAAPQTGEMTTLRQGDAVHVRWQPERARGYAVKN